MSEPDSEFSINLPLEIERLILELSAHANPGSAATLVRVSMHVSQWILPILYEMIIVGLGDYEAPIASLEQNGHHVRHLLLGHQTSVSDAGVERFLYSCPKVTSLAFWYNRDLNEAIIEGIKRLPLTRLSIRVESLFDSDEPIPPQAERFFTSFPQLTYLDVSHTIIPEKVSDYLQYIPSLTYLTLAADPDWEDVQPLSEVFAEIPQLEFVVFLKHNPTCGDYSCDIEEGAWPPEKIVANCDVPNFIDDWRNRSIGVTDALGYVVDFVTTLRERRNTAGLGSKSLNEAPISP